VQGGITARDKIQELAALLNREASSRTSERQITLFKNTPDRVLPMSFSAHWPSKRSWKEMKERIWASREAKLI
jgi:hypothetical protein